MKIRKPTAADLPPMKLILQDTELFPPDALDQMIQPYLAGDDEQAHWLVCTTDSEEVIGFSFSRLEQFTEGTWNLLAIGFRAAYQGDGLGTRLIEAVEHALADARMLMVETSSLDDFEATRRFYTNRGFTQEAVIRDYWAPGDDKVIFCKVLSR